MWPCPKSILCDEGQEAFKFWWWSILQEEDNFDMAFFILLQVHVGYKILI